MSLETYFAILTQNSGAKEFVLVGDSTRPPTKKEPREAKPPERTATLILLSDTRPPACPKRKERCDRLSVIEANNNKKRSPSRKINSLKDVFDEITTPLQGILDGVENGCDETGIGAPYNGV
jgi:hypothetical protein